MEERTQSLRRPWLAGVLSLVAPGLGHLYAGRARDAAIVAALNLVVVPGIWVLWAWEAFSVKAVFLLTSVLGLGVWVGGAAWAAIGARAENRDLKPPRRFQVASGYVAFALASLLARMASDGYLGEHAIGWYEVAGDSMAPTLVKGDRVVARKLGDAVAPARGTVAIFEDESQQQQVKRVVALEGDTVEISAGKIRLNGVELADAAMTDQEKKVVVPKGHFFVLGDNTASSSDSRSFGPVPLERYRGKVEGVYLSSELGRIGRATP